MKGPISVLHHAIPRNVPDIGTPRTNKALFIEFLIFMLWTVSCCILSHSFQVISGCSWTPQHCCQSRFRPERLSDQWFGLSSQRKDAYHSQLGNDTSVQDTLSGDNRSLDPSSPSLANRSYLPFIKSGSNHNSTLWII